MRRTVTALAIATITVGAALLAAGPAEARERLMLSPATPALVWTQSFERSTADAPCVAPTYLDIAWQADWNPAEQAWLPTWEQWANNGAGGWTCFRQITWAKGSPEVWEPLD